MYGQIIEAPPGISTATLGGESLTDLILSPSSTVVSFDDLSIYRIGEGTVSYPTNISINPCDTIIDLRFIESLAPSSALPIGATRVVSEMQPVQINPAHSGSGLLNAVLALLAPPNPDENERYDEEILDLNVIGFLVVCVFILDPATGAIFTDPSFFTRNRTSIDILSRKMTILAPNQGSFAGRTAIIGSFEWQDQ
jgi:polyribonucleotide 5'-hydroxyl-kinase